MTNPLLEDWDTPFGLPPFSKIEETHYLPAFETALASWRAEVEAVSVDPATPTFANTIEAIERSGRDLDKVAGVFFSLSGSDTTEGLQEIEEKIAPVLAKSSAEVFMDPRLFARVDALIVERASLGLTAEQDRVLGIYHDGFVRAGAKLDDAGRARMSAIMQRLATLGAQFSKNLLADEKAFELVLDEGDLDGLSDAEKSAMARAASDRGHAGKWLVTASRSSVEPFLQSSKRRDLREAVWRGFVGRGADRPETATKDIAAETIRLRDERAKLLGFANFSSYKLDNQMAKTPDAVRDLLRRVWTPAKAAAERDREKLQALVAEEGGNFAIEPWDWAFYAEILRQREHDLDDAELKPYMQLDNMIEAAFDTASKLFGLSFRELPDAPRHHPDVRVWDVTDKNGEHVGVFMGDYFARPSKRSGAWMSGFRSQENMDGVVRPIVTNTCNFVQAGEGEPSLLTFEDARTLFHEFGHALHGLTSNVTYPRVSGTSVARDFVELPSQLYEHWLMTPEVLKRFALHSETGEAMPQDLLDRVIAAQNFDMGNATVQYLSSALVDIEMHTAEIGEDFDPLAFEAGVLADIAMPDGIAMRHRTPHFGHVFSGDGYSSGYYSYMWSEVMDADAFGAFEEAGDVFDPETAKRLLTAIYSAGGREEPEAAYLAFRGRPPEVEALLKRRGLHDAA